MASRNASRHPPGTPLAWPRLAIFCLQPWARFPLTSEPEAPCLASSANRFFARYRKWSVQWSDTSPGAKRGRTLGASGRSRRHTTGGHRGPSVAGQLARDCQPGSVCLPGRTVALGIAGALTAWIPAVRAGFTDPESLLREQ
jgi:hypothetical protein